MYLEEIFCHKRTKFKIGLSVILIVRGTYVLKENLDANHFQIFGNVGSKLEFNRKYRYENRTINVPNEYRKYFYTKEELDKRNLKHKLNILIYEKY